MTNPLHLPFATRTQVFRLPIPHGLRTALPAKDQAEAALSALLAGGEVPRLKVSRFNAQLASAPAHVVLGAPASWTDAQLRWAYVVLLRQFGTMNDRYGKLFEVVDQGVDHTTTNAPVSKTKAATGMHTDSSDARYNPDLVALLCLQPGSRGGQSLLASASELLARLRKSHPTLEAVARMPWPRDVVTPGLAQDLSAIEANAIPVFSGTGNGLEFRYMRYWTERAMDKLGQPVPANLTRLFDFIDADLDKNALRFNLKRGDMLLVNNRLMVHGRAAFEDQPGAARRCLVRAWVDGFADSPGNRLPLRD